MITLSCSLSIKMCVSPPPPPQQGQNNTAAGKSKVEFLWDAEHPTRARASSMEIMFSFTIIIS